MNSKNIILNHDRKQVEETKKLSIDFLAAENYKGKILSIPLVNPIASLKLSSYMILA